MGFGAIGFGDDYLKLTRRSSHGLPSRFKFLAQIAVGVAAGVWIMTISPVELRTHLTIPVLKDILIDLGWFFVPFATFVMVGASNAVNLTDGLDGLAIVPVMIAAASSGSKAPGRS